MMVSDSELANIPEENCTPQSGVISDQFFDDGLSDSDLANIPEENFTPQSGGISDQFFEDGLSDSELANIPKEDFTPQSGGKLHLKLEPFRKRHNVDFGIVRNAFHLRWQADDDISPKQLRH